MHFGTIEPSTKGYFMSENKPFPAVVETKFVMNNSGFCVAGEYLGYEWNHVCDEISNSDLYAQDGDGSINIRRKKDPKKYTDNVVMRAIIVAIFEHYPDVKEIMIVND
jgi:hypothetical protein